MASAAHRYAKSAREFIASMSFPVSGLIVIRICCSFASASASTGRGTDFSSSDICAPSSPEDSNPCCGIWGQGQGLVVLGVLAGEQTR
eukprot:5079691-Prymnesium_polylepis.5